MVFSGGIVRFIAMTTRFYTFLRHTRDVGHDAFISAALGVLPLLCLGTSVLPGYRVVNSRSPRACMARRVCRILHVGLTSVLTRGSSCLRMFLPSVTCDSRPVGGGVSRSLTSVCRSVGSFVFMFRLKLGRAVGSSLTVYRRGFKLL